MNVSNAIGVVSAVRTGDDYIAIRNTESRHCRRSERIDHDEKSKLNVMCFEWDASPPLVELSIVWSVAGVKCLVTLV